MRFASILRTSSESSIAQSLCCPGGRVDFGEWQDLLSRSRAVVVAHGSGEKTFRLPEVAAAGVAMLVERFSPGNEPAGLSDGENALYFEQDGSNLIEQAKRLATSPFLAARLGEAAKEWAQQHTPEALARRIIGV